jgi:hypothetical protein
MFTTRYPYRIEVASAYATVNILEKGSVILSPSDKKQTEEVQEGAERLGKKVDEKVG